MKRILEEAKLQLMQLRAPQFAVCMLLGVLFTYWNTVNQVWLDNDVASGTGKAAAWGKLRLSDPPGTPVTYYAPPLPDELFEWLPYHKDIPGLGDYLLLACIVSAAVPFLLLDPRRVTMLRRFALLQGVMFLFRSFCIRITLLPNPFPDCVPLVTPDVWMRAALIMTGERNTCSDVLFSGHSVNMTLSLLAWVTYNPIGLTPRSLTGPPTWLLRIMRLLIVVLVFAGYYGVVSTHFHYSVDVYLGALLVTFVWATYHLVALNTSLREHPTSWWAAAVRWLEGSPRERELFMYYGIKTGSAFDLGPAELQARAMRSSSRAAGRIGASRIDDAASPAPHAPSFTDDEAEDAAEESVDALEAGTRKSTSKAAQVVGRGSYGPSGGSESMRLSSAHARKEDLV